MGQHQAKMMDQDIIMPPTVKDEVVQQLGAGTFGTVSVVKHKTGVRMVRKRMHCNKHDDPCKSALLRELAVLQYLKEECKQYVLCVEYVRMSTATTPTSKKIIVDVYTPIHKDTTTLKAWSGVISQPQEINLFVMGELARGLQFMHKRGVIHRDIKPDNIIIYRSSKNNALRVKYVDFGLACLRPTEKEFSDCFQNVTGTTLYMAPELFLPTPPMDFESAKAADVWALGITFAYIVFRLGITTKPGENRRLKDDNTSKASIEQIKVIKRLSRGESYDVPKALAWYGKIAPESMTKYMQFFARTLAVDPFHRPLPLELIEMIQILPKQSMNTSQQLQNCPSERSAIYYSRETAKDKKFGLGVDKDTQTLSDIIDRSAALIANPDNGYPAKFVKNIADICDARIKRHKKSDNSADAASALDTILKIGDLAERFKTLTPDLLVILNLNANRLREALESVMETNSDVIPPKLVKEITQIIANIKVGKIKTDGQTTFAVKKIIEWAANNLDQDNDEELIDDIEMSLADFVDDE
jgi:serine/threonine protein kinase